MRIQFHLWFKQSDINEENVSVPTSVLRLENSGDTLTEECILCVLLDL